MESGTVNLPAIAGLSAGIDFINSVGIKNILAHEYGLIQYIYDELSRMDFVELYTEKPEYPRFAPLLAFNVKGMESTAVAQLLDKENIAVRAGLHCAPLAHRKFGSGSHGSVRVSFGYANTAADGKQILNAVTKCKKIVF
jgi:selenocysteine lyase/cysteine desulfurase